jgi:hypothetical protein
VTLEDPHRDGGGGEVLCSETDESCDGQLILRTSWRKAAVDELAHRAVDRFFADCAAGEMAVDVAVVCRGGDAVDDQPVGAEQSARVEFGFGVVIGTD